ncbi:Fructose-bisphosphate aldolase, cytoplasmic isozyme, partial [Tetrabaena socialis]
DMQRLLSRRRQPAAEPGPYPDTLPSAAAAPPPMPTRDVGDPDRFLKMYGDEEATWRDMPMRMMPRSREENRKLMDQMQMEAYLSRMWNHEDVDDLAFYEEGKMRTKAHNIYANVRAVANIMHEIEDQDFSMAEKQSYFTSWARAELLFAQEYDVFNEMVKQNIDSIVRQPLEEVRCGLVPIVEPEVLSEGSHGIERAEKATGRVLAGVFRAMRKRRDVDPGALLLKAAMVTPGSQGPAATPEEAPWTMHI